MKKRRLHVPVSLNNSKTVHAGEHVVLTGTLYTARDAALARLVEYEERGEAFPVDLKDQMIYFTGPAPSLRGLPVGSAGPTSSVRMCPYMELMLQKGVRGFIGKGDLPEEYKPLFQKYNALYLLTVAGAGALLATCVTAYEPLAFHDLGTECIARMEVRDMPAWVALDVHGADIYAADANSN